MTSLEGSIDYLLQGYLICKGCGRRLTVIDEPPASELEQAVSNILGRQVRVEVRPNHKTEVS